MRDRRESGWVRTATTRRLAALVAALLAGAAAAALWTGDRDILLIAVVAIAPLVGTYVFSRWMMHGGFR